MAVSKAIIAAAGLGTRFLPWTKAMPKEMLPLGKEPVIQHIVEGLVAAGVKQIAIVGGPQKRAIENHFDPSVELEQALTKRGKKDLVKELQKISNLANFIYMGQKGDPPGNARPLLNALDAGFIGEQQSEPFFYMFADDFFQSKTPHAKQLLDVFEETNKSVISLIKIKPEQADKYGVAKIKKQLNSKLYEISDLIEKPGAKNRPSDFAAVNGYLLTPEIIPFVKALKPSKRGEIEVPEAIGMLARKDRVVGLEVSGRFHDAGNPTGYAIAVLDYALSDPETAKEIKQYLKSRIK